MAYLPGFDHDIFISYAHLNNPTADGGAKGWVTRFHERLEVELQQRLGEKVGVWRDPKLGGNDLFDQKIEEAIKGAGLLVALNSNAYMNSDYCRQELEEFYAKARSERWGLDIGGSRRIFNVMLNSIPHAKWDAAFNGTTGYKFYKEDPHDEIAPPVKINTNAFAKDIESLAGDLAHTLKEFKTAIQNKPQNEPDGGIDYPSDEEILRIRERSGSNPWLKRIVAAGILILAAVVIAGYWIRQPKPIVETIEEADDLNESLQQWTPPDIGWHVEQVGVAYGRRIRGDVLGLFKTAHTKNQFNLYRDFTLDLDVRFTGKKGVAWIVRARDFDNYYLFELTKPAQGPWPAELNFYKYEQGARRLLGSARPEINVEDDRDNFLITTEAKGGTFDITIRPASYREPGSQKLKSFTDGAFAYGGVGFLPKDGREVLLQQLRIEPH